MASSMGSSLEGEFSEDSVPMPGTLMIAAGTEHVEQDAAETKLSEMSLHKFLILFFQFWKFAYIVHEEETDEAKELAEASLRIPV